MSALKILKTFYSIYATSVTSEGDFLAEMRRTKFINCDFCQKFLMKISPDAETKFVLSERLYCRAFGSMLRQTMACMQEDANISDC